MREIKFRGKRIDGEGWVYGNLSMHKNGSCEIENTKEELPWWYHVNPDTVGEYTGLKDKNGKEVYEGDIITNEYYKNMVGQVEYGKYHENGDLDGPVDFVGFFIKWSDCCCSYVDFTQYVVIGNIHDNADLLSEG